MNKFIFIPLLLLIIAVITFNVYKYREQNLADLVKIKDVEKFYIVLGNKRPETIELLRADDESINQLTKFLNQYQVKLTTTEGWSSEHPSEKFALYLEYKDGVFKIYEFEHDIVAWTRIYKVVNPPLDYKAIDTLEQRLISE